MKTIYNVTEQHTNKVHTFKSISKAKQFIENWGTENDQNLGKVDINRRTILWNVGTFKEPILQFSRHTIFN